MVENPEILAGPGHDGPRSLFSGEIRKNHRADFGKYTDMSWNDVRPGPRDLCTTPGAPSVSFATGGPIGGRERLNPRDVEAVSEGAEPGSAVDEEN
jgi:hypothetical protein